MKLVDGDDDESGVVLKVAATKMGDLSEHGGVELGRGKRRVGLGESREFRFAEFFAVR